MKLSGSYHHALDSPIYEFGFNSNLSLVSLSGKMYGTSATASYANL